MKKFKPKRQTGGGNSLGVMPENPYDLPVYTVDPRTQAPIVTSPVAPGVGVDRSGIDAFAHEPWVQQMRARYQRAGFDEDLNFDSNSLRFTRGTGAMQDSPYVKGFNMLATGVTGIANWMSNNRLKDQEQQQVNAALQPRYWENMERSGLNNIPAYTKYGGVGTEEDWMLEGIAHKGNPYGEVSAYNSYSNPRYKAGGSPSAAKAGEILHDGKVHGKPITDRQRRYFGAIVSAAKKQTGGAATKLKPFAPYNTGVPLYTPESNDEAGFVPTAPTNPDDVDALAWTQSYVNSPKYTERLANSFKYPGYVQRQRAAKLSNVGFSEAEGANTGYTNSTAYPNQVRVGLNQLRGNKISRSEAVVHELGHVSNANETNPALRLTPNDESFIFDRNRTITPELRQSYRNSAADSSLSEYLGEGETHDIAPSETMSDVQALRYFMNKNKIYDARTQDITPEMLQKAKSNPEIQKQFSTKRLFDNFNDQSLIEILNRIALNDNPDSDMTIAKHGGPGGCDDCEHSKIMQAGGSIVNYMQSQNMDSSFKNRKKLFDQYFGGAYKGTAEQNTQMLRMLAQNGQDNLDPNNIPSASARNKMPSLPFIPAPRAANIPQSGVVVDKGTNTAYIVKDGRITNFPVLTGKNPKDASNLGGYNPNVTGSKSTPTGYYVMNNNVGQHDLQSYDNNIMGLSPIAADGLPAPLADYLAIHQTADPGVRNKYYAQPAGNRYASSGCINCQKPDIENVMSQFPKGDTLMVIDSKMPKFKNAAKQLGIKQTGGAAVGETYGLPPELSSYANVEAEEGEVFESRNGTYNKIADDAGTHEEGGVMLSNVSRVLEDTSDKRKDKVSKILKMSPDEVNEMFGFKPKRPMSHAAAFEFVTEQNDKERKKYTDAMERIGDRKVLDKYMTNSAKLDFQNLQAVPDNAEIFDALYMHQEAIKDAAGINDDGSRAKTGGKYQAGGSTPFTPYSGGQTPRGRTTPAGNPNAFTFPGGLPALVKAWQDAGFDMTGVNTPSQFQERTYDQLLGTPEGREILRTMWDQGNTARGIQRDVLADRFPEGNFRGSDLTDVDLAALKTAYVDNMLGVRTISPSVNTTTTPTSVTPILPVPPGQPQPPDTSVNMNRPLPDQPRSRFNEPTYWDELAPGLLSLADSFGRDPELYNPVEFNQLRYRLQDPTAAMNANQADYNAAAETLGNVPVGSGVALSNLANLTAQKYRANNQIMGQYDNQNAQIKNQEILYNTQVRDRQAGADAQSRGQYYQNVLQARDNQRLQRLKAIEDLGRAAQLKRRQNRSGNLIMQLSPAFDQFGEYNGYQYIPTLNPALGVSQVPVPTTTKKATSGNNTKTTTTWKLGDKVIKTTESTPK